MSALPEQFLGPIYQAGAQIYSGLLPIPDTKMPEVKKAFETFKQVCENAAMGIVRLASDPEPGTRQRGRGAPPMNDAIVALLSSEPRTMRTPRQVWSGIKSAYPKQTSETVQTRLKKDAGKPGLWIPVGNKYGMPGATATAKAQATKTTTKTAAADPNVVPAPAALPGEKPQTRVLNYVIAHGGHTKRQIISAFAASPTPIKAQYVGVELGRLTKSKKITGLENGPYWPLVAASPLSVVAGIGNGAPTPA